MQGKDGIVVTYFNLCGYGDTCVPRGTEGASLWLFFFSSSKGNT